MILVVSSRFDKTGEVVKGLEQSCLAVLEKKSIPYIHIQVPGAVEIPVTVQRFLNLECREQRTESRSEKKSVGANPCVCPTKKFRAVIALGCIIKGETHHYEWVMNACERGLTRVSLDSGIPVIQGVLACPDAATAIARKHHGAEYAETAIEMVEVLGL